MVRVSCWIGTLALGLSVHACQEPESGKAPHSCTEKGCLDSARFTLHPPEDVWQNGVYALDITFDDAAYFCAYTIPDAIDSAQNKDFRIPIHCAPDLDGPGIFGATLEPVVVSITHSDGSSRSQTHTAIPGSYYLSVLTPTLAKSVSVTITLDAEPFFAASEPFSYVLNQPNGSDCEPTCHSGFVEFRVPVPTQR